VFFSSRVHPEARRAEGSKETLRRFVPPFPKKGRDFAPQDEESKDAKNSPTPQITDYAIIKNYPLLLRLS